MLNVRQIHSMSDFRRNHKAPVARLKETSAAEVLTLNGRAEVVVLDAESYQQLVDRIRNMEAITRIREEFRRQGEAHAEPMSYEELDRTHRFLDELVEETERLDFYK